MNIHLSRNGQQFGPYPIESLAEMIRGGQVLPTDLLLAEGQSDWVPVSSFLKFSGVSPTPPPLPPTAAPPAEGGLRLASPTASAAPPVIPPIAEGTSDLERQVLEGGRFVIYQYCISILVLK